MTSNMCFAARSVLSSRFLQTSVRSLTADSAILVLLSHTRVAVACSYCCRMLLLLSPAPIAVACSCLSKSLRVTACEPTRANALFLRHISPPARRRSSMSPPRRSTGCYALARPACCSFHFTPPGLYHSCSLAMRCLYWPCSPCVVVHTSRTISFPSRFYRSVHERFLLRSCQRTSALLPARSSLVRSLKKTCCAP